MGEHRLRECGGPGHGWLFLQIQLELENNEDLESECGVAMYLFVRLDRSIAEAGSGRRHPHPTKECK